MRDWKIPSLWINAWGFQAGHTMWLCWGQLSDHSQSTLFKFLGHLKWAMWLFFPWWCKFWLLPQLLYPTLLTLPMVAMDSQQKVARDGSRMVTHDVTGGDWPLLTAKISYIFTVHAEELSAPQGEERCVEEHSFEEPLPPPQPQGAGCFLWHSPTLEKKSGIEIIHRVLLKLSFLDAFFNFFFYFQHSDLANMFLKYELP